VGDVTADRGSQRLADAEVEAVAERGDEAAAARVEVAMFLSSPVAVT